MPEKSLVRPAERADTAEAVRTMARAFADDPVFWWLFPSPEDHRHRCARFFAVYLGMEHIP
jgi:hypothetical protein